MIVLSKLLALKLGLLLASTLAGHAPAPAYGTWGNTTLPDCQYAAPANLVVAEFPGVIIATSDVVAAYDTYGSSWIDGHWAGQWYLLNVGFSGHRATSITTINESQVLGAANNGGVEVQLWESAWNPLDASLSHDVAIVRATATDIFVVNSWDPIVQDLTWAQWDAAFAPFVIAYSAVTW
jgi:hypothetical protein